MSEYRILIRTCLQLHVHEYLDSILSQHICQSNVDHIRISSNFPGEMKHSKATPTPALATPTRLCLAQHLRIDPLHFGTTHWDLVDFTPSNNMAGLGVSQLQSTGGKMFQCHVRKAGSTVCPVCVSAHPVPSCNSANHQLWSTLYILFLYMKWISCHSSRHPFPSQPSHLKVFHKAKSQALHLHGSSQSSHDVSQHVRHLKMIPEIWCSVFCHVVPGTINIKSLETTWLSTKVPTLVSPVAAPVAVPGSVSTRERTSAMERTPHLQPPVTRTWRMIYH